MSDPSADKPTTLNQSGGVTIHAETVNITGDVIGRDGINAGGGSGSSGAGSGGSSGNSGSNDSKPPLELSLRFEKTGDGDDAPLMVSASIVGQPSTSEAVKFEVQLDPKVMADLRWYLELYPQWPVGPDYDRALGIEANLIKWGKALFDAAFSTPKLMRVYEQFRLKDGGKSITIDATDPRVLQLPWELLADEGGYVFTQRPPINVRRKLRVAREPKTQAFTLPVRILMVISRPEGDHIGFLDPRSSAQALLDAIEPLGDQVKVEFLYPPTLKALTQRVRDPRLPPVHVVHFDGHGVYRPDTGLGYLLFENDEHQAQLVNAADLGTLLNDTGVPLMLLDACQTAQTDQANPFGSVASKLIEAGIGSVLAMNYSVLVSATRLLTTAFYGGLAQGQTIGQAVDAARFAMLMEPERAKLYRNGKEEAIQLRDWFLPALYQQASDPAPFAAPRQTSPRSTGGGAATSPLSKTGERSGVGASVPTYPARGGFPDEPRYGFHGRERELLHLRRTLADKPIVVVHGYGGQGKTTLAAHAARWFTRTHLFERAVFVSFERGGGLDYVLSEMGAALLGDNFASTEPAGRIDALAAELRRTPTLVVWDNFESILPNGDAPLPDADLQKLLSAAATWFAHDSRTTQPASLVTRYSSRLIVTTRDTNLPHPSFSPGRTAAHTELPGLGLSDALDLAAQILKDNGIARPPREGLAELLIHLGGHPLSIQLVVPHLRTYTPEKLITEFDALLPGFTAGAGQARNESLRVSLDFSLRRLGEDTRQLLPDLAVFQHGGMEAQVLKVTQWKPSQWRLIRDELARAALLTIDQGAGLTLNKTDEGPFSGYYVRFHPTLLPYLATRLTPQRRAELEPRYGQAYYALAEHCYQNDSKAPIPTRAIVSRELPNFRRALDLTLAAGDTDAAASFADKIARFLNVFGRWSERDAMMGEVDKAVRKQVNKGQAPNQQSTINNQQSKMVGGPSSTVTRAEFLMASQQGERLLQQGRAAQAEKVFRDLLARLGDAPSYERAVTLRYIGLSLADQGKQSAAAEFHRQKLSVLAGLEQTNNVKHETGVAHTDLGDVLTDMGQFDAARREYETALKIVKDLDDDRSEAVIIELLGTLALTRGDLAEARARYVEALPTYKRIGESRAESIIWHQLGRVAEEAKDWPEAERYHKEGLAIDERLGDKESIAKTCNQLALVAESANRPDEAERWYKQAIELKEQVGNPTQLARSLNNLAGLYLAQERLNEAEQFAQRAREIKETLDLSSEPWTTYSILAQIADKRGRVEEARQWRKKEQETFAAFAGSDFQIRQYQGLIERVAQAAQGNAEAQRWLEGEYAKMQAGGEEWARTAKSIQRLVAGEHDADSLTENLSRIGSLIVRRVLGLLAQPSPPTRAEPPARGTLPTTGEGSAVPPSPVGEGDEPQGESGEGDGATPDAAMQALNQFLGIFVAGARGDSQAGNAAYQIARDMQSAAQPPEVRAMGKGLQNVLEGLRGDDAIAGLPPQVADIVQMVLQQLA